jgi:predicted phosphodiesterase
MNILALSDLHMERLRRPVLSPGEAIDVVVLAGDIDHGRLGLAWAREQFPTQEIVYVAGNHELWGSDLPEMMDSLRVSALVNGIHFLENDSVVLKGVRFIGATLWSDFTLFGDDMREAAMSWSHSVLQDYWRIRVNGRRLTPTHTAAFHEASVAYITRTLQDTSHPTVVVTHHAPSSRSVIGRWRDDPVSASYASPLEPLVGQANLWIHGHTHVPSDYTLNGCRVVCSPLERYTAIEL